MLSRTIWHIEQLNKVMRIRKFFDNLEKLGTTGNATEDAFRAFCAVAIENGVKDEKKQKKMFDELLKDNDGLISFLSYVKSCCMVEAWYVHKQIYKFDSDALDMIKESKPQNLSYEELCALKLPYETFAVENSFEFKGDVDCIMFNRRIEDGVCKVSIYFFLKDADAILTIDMEVKPNATLLDVLIEEEASDECKKAILEFMAVVMYLCQPKTEVRKIKGNLSSNKKAKKEIPNNFYSVPYDENVVGVRLGNAIRNYKVVYEKGDSPLTPNREKRHVRPHCRCGHFHRYWVGKGRTDLVVKFVEPTYVLGGNKQATIHEVK